MISEKISYLIKKSLEENLFTACAIGVQKLGEKSSFTTLGFVDEKKTRVVDETTMFDLASLTKVMFTTTLAAKLFQDQKIKLDVPFSEHKGLEEIVKNFHNPNYLNCTFEDLLLHRAGFPAGANYPRIFPEKNREIPLSDIEFSQQLIRCTTAVRPAYPRKTKTLYSDPGFVLLSEMLGLLQNNTAEHHWKKMIQEPLGLYNTKSFKQLSGNEKVVPSAKSIKAGLPQDPRARYLGRLCGHAGLFGDIQNVVSFGLVWLQAYVSGHPYLSQDTVRRFVDPYIKMERRLGWDGVSPQSTAGNISLNSIGHLGYTGTSLWIDLERKMVVGILTNRSWSALKKSTDLMTDEQRIEFNHFRRSIHNCIWEDRSS